LTAFDRVKKGEEEMPLNRFGNEGFAATIAVDFSLEELEPRMEMQALGFTVDPSIVQGPNGIREVVPVVDEFGRVIGYT
jgi:hypothetical protein